MLNALAAHFGIPPGQLLIGSGMQTEDGALVATFRVALVPADIAGASSRLVRPEDQPRDSVVMLHRGMLTQSQCPAPIDAATGQYVVAVKDLTDAQRKIPHVDQQLRTLAEAKKIAARPPVPYSHVWKRFSAHSNELQELQGIDLVYAGDEVAFPWDLLDTKHRIGLRMIPASETQNESAN